jgi:xanthine/CO dehydrogenase XdhC/CoxF family maturation factor
VHLGIPALLDFFREHRHEDSLVLATITATGGSTYRKPGAMMLISRDGSYEGMISGGCLEGDLLLHAGKVFDSGNVSRVTYDMHADDSLVWNLGLGCDGVVHLLLQRLDRQLGFGFLTQLEQSQSRGCACLIALVIDSPEPPVCGDFALLDQHDISVGNEGLVELLRSCCGDWPDWRTKTHRARVDGGEQNVLLIHAPPRVSVLICGAGPDAVPVAETLSGLDWKIRLVDHRPAFADARRFPPCCEVIEARPGKLSDAVDLELVDAVVIMSHHLEHDAEYLRQLGGRDIPYVGLLGPAARRERLREMAGCTDSLLHGPAGLDIGAELPEAIALSIAAEIHAVLNGRDGRVLTMKAGGKNG